MAQAGFDWLAVDMEHSVIGIETAQILIQVVELSGCVPLVRLSSNDPVLAKRVMDAGAHGVIVPGVNSSAEVEQAVKAVRYPPRRFQGGRSGTRAGVRVPIPGVSARAGGIRSRYRHD